MLLLCRVLDPDYMGFRKNRWERLSRDPDALVIRLDGELLTPDYGHCR